MDKRRRRTIAVMLSSSLVVLLPIAVRIGTTVADTNRDDKIVILKNWILKISSQRRRTGSMTSALLEAVLRVSRSPFISQERGCRSYSWRGEDWKLITSRKRSMMET